MKDARRVLNTYKKLLSIIARRAPLMVAMTFVLAIVSGALSFASPLVNQHIVDDGLQVASGAMAFGDYIPWLALLVVTMVLPPVINELCIYGYIEPRSQMILNTDYKGEMLQKLGRAKYEHFENSQSVEIIDKATSRAMNSARHLYPMYLFNALSGAVASIGLLWQLGQAKWWLLLTTLIPFALHRWYGAKHSYNIYDELEHYWNKERRYGILAGFLKSRDYLYEGKLNGCADFLIRTYRDRLHERNKEYETYYFKHLKQHLLRAGSIMNLASLGNALLLLYLYAQGEISIGSLVALSAMVLSSLSQHLSSATGIVIWAGYHLQFTDYYDKFFALSEDSAPGKAAPAPETFDIEFRDVWFRYPGSEENPYILKGLSFRLAGGEKISIVGANGEGKSTMIKLLLGLFEPERGQILLGGRLIEQYTREQRNRVFAPVFQDFMRYSISLRENIAVGDIELLRDESAILAAAEKGQAKKIADGLKDGMDTLLGRDFEGGVDLSGGQWQRIALSRAFMGDKPILLLDEPTSQLDPMAESRLYSEFHALAEGKTAIFITHRLASTMITDRILVLSDGRVSEEGNHEQLMQCGGLYRAMFDAQRKWYDHAEEEEAMA